MVTAFAGAAAGVFIDMHGDDGERFSPTLGRRFDDGETVVRWWLTAFVGVRFE